MFGHSIDHSLYKVVGGACVVGEVAAFAHSDEVKQILWLVGGAVTFAFHFGWNQIDQRRRSREQEQESARRNREQNDELRRRKAFLDALQYRVLEDMKNSKGMPSDEVMRLLLGNGAAIDPIRMAEAIHRASGSPIQPAAPAPALGG